MRFRGFLILTAVLSIVAVPALLCEDSYGDLNVIEADRAYFADGCFVLEFDPGISGDFQCQVTDSDGNSIMESAPVSLKNETRVLFAPDDRSRPLPTGEYRVQMYSPAAVVSEIVDVPVLATGISLDRVNVDIETGQSTVLTASVSPDDVSDKSVSWESSDPKVATVDPNGKVTAVSAGTADVKAVSGDGMASAVCRVTVTQTSEPIPDVPVVPDTPDGGTDGGDSDGSQTTLIVIVAVALLMAAAAAIVLLRLRRAP